MFPMFPLFPFFKEISYNLIFYERLLKNGNIGNIGNIAQPHL